VLPLATAHPVADPVVMAPIADAVAIVIAVVAIIGSIVASAALVVAAVVVVAVSLVVSLILTLVVVMTVGVLVGLSQSTWAAHQQCHGGGAEKQMFHGIVPSWSGLARPAVTGFGATSQHLIFAAVPKRPRDWKIIN